MCGLAGLVRLGGIRPEDPEVVLRMRDTMRHRGPDDEGSFTGGKVALGFRRLSIIDLAGGHQPMSNEDGTVHVVLNGEIYNFADLRREIGEHRHAWKTCSDTEVLVHGFEEWGIDGLATRLNGMFAFAVWDERAQTLHLVRDRLGIKPLYFAHVADGLFFASEVQAFRHAVAVDLRHQPEALRYFFSVSYIPAPLSIHRGVRKLEAGTRLSLDRGGTRMIRYWDLPEPLRASRVPEDPARWREELLGLLQSSVRMQMRSDVPVGLFLSAGLDSSVICSLFTSFAGRGASSFTLGFRERGFSEEEGARRVACGYRTDHHVATAPEPDETFLRDMVRAYGEPFGDSSAANVLRLSELARRHVTVALSGDGGDEALGGYQTYRATGLAATYARSPRWMRNLLHRAAGAVLRADDRKVSAALKARLFLENARLDPLEAHFAWRRICRAGEMEELLPAGLADASFEDRYYTRVHDLVPEGDLDPLNLLMYLDIRAYLADDMLTKVDRASMWHSLEVRVPFLDHRIVEWSMRVPGDSKVSGGRTKVILREALAGRVPDGVRGLPKAGFNAPINVWFRGSLSGLLTDLLAARPDAPVRRPTVHRWIREHRRRQTDHSHRLWNVLVFLLWLEEAGGSAAP